MKSKIKLVLIGALGIFLLSFLLPNSPKFSDFKKIKTYWIADDESLYPVAFLSLKKKETISKTFILYFYDREKKLFLGDSFFLKVKDGKFLENQSSEMKIISTQKIQKSDYRQSLLDFTYKKKEKRFSFMIFESSFDQASSSHKRSKILEIILSDSIERE